MNSKVDHILRKTLQNFIAEKLKVERSQLDKLGLIGNSREEIQLIASASKIAKKPIPDDALNRLRAWKDLIEFLAEKKKVPRILGIPGLEIFDRLCLSDLPKNISLINYHKKKWPNAFPLSRLNAIKD